MVNLLLSAGRPNAFAYDATILDLAARGYLAASARPPTGLWLAYREPPLGPDVAPLTGFEQRMLDDLHRRLRAIGDAPFLALAELCRVDVAGIWRPFDEELRAEASRRGLGERPSIMLAGRPRLTPLGAEGRRTGRGGTRRRPAAGAGHAGGSADRRPGDDRRRRGRRSAAPGGRSRSPTPRSWGPAGARCC
jgi:hypothetical protein